MALKNATLVAFLKRVIVTPAVDPRLKTEATQNNLQSTGQNTQGVQIYFRLRKKAYPKALKALHLAMF